jgi:hypothetical protein
MSRLRHHHVIFCAPEHFIKITVMALAENEDQAEPTIEIDNPIGQVS